MSKETANTKKSVNESVDTSAAEMPDASAPTPPVPVRAEDLDERLKLALNAAADKKAIDPIVLDLRPIANFTDFFLIASGSNTRQVQAIADEVIERLKHEGVRAGRVEGRQSAEWVLLDYGDFIVHVFEGKARQFYDLERLWRDAARVQLPAEYTEGGTGSLREGS